MMRSELGPPKFHNSVILPNCYRYYNGDEGLQTIRERYLVTDSLSPRFYLVETALGKGFYIVFFVIMIERNSLAQAVHSSNHIQEFILSYQKPSANGVL